MNENIKQQGEDEVLLPVVEPEPVKRASRKPRTEPVTEPVIEPVPEPVIEPVTDAPKPWVQTYFESEYQTHFLKSTGQPVCKVCGTGYHGDGCGKFFCPNKHPDCPLVDENGYPR